MAVETARASPNRRNVPKVYTVMTERHQMRTLTKNQMALFFWNGVVFITAVGRNDHRSGVILEVPRWRPILYFSNLLVLPKPAARVVHSLSLFVACSGNK
jgi:hypothetical protein